MDCITTQLYSRDLLCRVLSFPKSLRCFSVEYPTVNTNFSTKNVVYTFVVNGLEADNEYSFNVVAVNTFGETRIQGYRFQTRNEGT